MLVISPYDKNSLGAIEKAIQLSGLGLAPSNDGQIIRLNFPPLTEERRKELVRLVKAMAEEGRVSIRHAARCSARPRGAGEGRGTSRRTIWRGPRRSSTSSPTITKPRWTRPSSTRSRSCSRFDPPPSTTWARHGCRMGRSKSGTHDHTRWALREEEPCGLTGKSAGSSAIAIPLKVSVSSVPTSCRGARTPRHQASARRRRAPLRGSAHSAEAGGPGRPCASRSVPTTIPPRSSDRPSCPSSRPPRRPSCRTGRVRPQRRSRR